MINSELREYCEGIISYYSDEYPYYFMHTNTTVLNTSYYQQTGATVYLSKTEPTVKSQFDMTSDEWLKVVVLSSNASRDDRSNRTVKSVVKGRVYCNDFEYVYTNAESIFAFSSVQIHSNLPAKIESETSHFYGVFMCACMLACVVATWIKRR